MKYFLDCGYRYGEAIPKLDKAFEFKNADDWWIHAFEPNPAHEIETYHTDIENITYHKCAAWIATGEMDFLQTPSGDVKDKKGGGCTLSEFKPKAPIEDTVSVLTIDLAAFILGLEDPERIILKLDVEGAEFAIVRHLLDSPAIDLIQDIFVEWHPQFAGKSTEDSDKLRAEIRKHNTIPHAWD